MSLWKRSVELCVVTFEFRDAWLSLLLLWIHIRYQHQVIIDEDQGEDEAGGQV